MKKFISSFILFCFLIWILPLGVFIKPSQEEKACNGQRAICLCTHLMGKQTKTVKVLTAQTSGTSSKEQNGYSSSHSFLAAAKVDQAALNISLYHREQSSLYSLVVVRSIDHVPIA